MKKTLFPSKRQRGFSLLEVLVSILIVSFAALALVGLQVRATQFSLGAEDRNTAAVLVDEIGAEMIMLKNSRLPSEQIASFQERAAQALPGGSLTISTTGDVSRITLTWKSPGSKPDAPPNSHFTDVVVFP
jgi:type IV pilus assembly protein PilV